MRLLCKKIRFLAGSIFFTEDRYEAVDLIKQGNPHAIRFVVRKPSTSYMKNIFLITFNLSVWVASVVVLAVFAAAVNIILNWETRNKQKVKQNKYGVSDVTLIALEAVCQQGTATEPQSFAGRILALILFGAFMFIYVSYSANIVVLLQSTTKINDVQELLDSRIEVGGCQIHYMKNYFEGVKKGPLRKLYEKKIYPDQYFPLEVGMKKVQDGNFAFHVAMQSAYEYILKHFTNHEICGLQELPGYIEENLGYIAVPKHSPYKDLFKVAILRIDEYGLQRRTNLRVLMTPKCFSQAASFKDVGFYDCEQVLWIWIFGTSLAFVIFLIERIMHSISKRIATKKGNRVLRFN
ncbi:ionotropic receptor 75a-like isoform X2 [Tenebrio molitor]|uniref:ionotropic receptor 75a-like isoform X2 n=1 Tax=Tenebrio molitor TaxID=7067 RepID=UPI0036247207